MVPQAAGGTSRCPSPASVPEGSLVPSGVAEFSRQSGTSKPTRLEGIVRSLRARGFSETVAQRIAAPQRLSTRSVYDSKWAIFADWCTQRDVDPFHPSIQVITNFLDWLFSVKKLVVMTIKGYRSAIAQTLGAMGRWQPVWDGPIRQLLLSMSRDRPRVKRASPSWDLNVVLEFLGGSFFEPMQFAELKFLTLKTVFLLALATAHRRSELHALSASGVRWRGEEAVLAVVPGFLAKSQVPNAAPHEVVVRALPNSRDRSLCPVRALRHYLERTGPLRDGRDRLFISYEQGLKKDISAQTISTWVVRLIRMAHDKSGVPIPADESVRAHDVRAMATSVAWKYNIPIQSLVDAAIWKSKDSFIDYYCRDLSGWTCAFPALVVGRHTINPPMAETDP